MELRSLSHAALEVSLICPDARMERDLRSDKVDEV
jgi:hypothetical protein